MSTYALVHLVIWRTQMQHLPDVEDDLKDWQSACKAVDFDLDIAESATFYECLLDTWSDPGWSNPGGENGLSRISIAFNNLRVEPQEKDYVRLLPALTAAFDAMVRLGIGHQSLPEFAIPVAYAGVNIASNLNIATKRSRIAVEASATLCTLYRGYYIDPDFNFCLRVLEHAISLGVRYRPDCIFDSHHNVTIYDCFVYYDWVDIWEEILEELGIDPDWASKENERRKRVVLAETSAHEVSVGVDTSDILQVQRRKVYSVSDD
ncbi:hypothetical protein BJ170DRAFT_679169 [Xylariales sp. AK1849]|nr:hypothetical protein BJ170DRAFT_679169 [Xylariales sp. AK1849]